MKKVLALVSMLCSPMAVGVALPNVLGILLALLQLGTNISFGALTGLYLTLGILGGNPFFLIADFVFLL